MNWRLAPSELTFIINDNDAKVLVVEAEFQDTVASILPDLNDIDLVVLGGPVTLDGADHHTSAIPSPLSHPAAAPDAFAWLARVARPIVRRSTSRRRR